MSERYGKCSSCKGLGSRIPYGRTELDECWECGGTGFGGGAFPEFNLPFDKHTHERKYTMTTTSLATKSKSVSLSEKFGFTDKQLDLIKRTVAKGATDDELELFFYRCKELQLNPLMPGQVYFLKFGSNPGTVIVGLDGFRARAARTGKLTGIKRGVIRNDKGECIGAWADIYRRDWDHPAHEEISLAEYADPRKQTWKNMPETMCKKVAEVAALRMAFPDDLGGIYLSEEMDQAHAREVKAEVLPKETKPSPNQIMQLLSKPESKSITEQDFKDYIQFKFSKKGLKDLVVQEFEILSQSVIAGTFGPELAVLRNQLKADEEPS